MRTFLSMAVVEREEESAASAPQAQYGKSEPVTGAYVGDLAYCGKLM